MFMVPQNSNYAAGFQTLPFVSCFQKYRLDYWLFNQRKMCLSPLPPSSLLSGLNLPKASKRCRPKKAGAPDCGRVPLPHWPPAAQDTRYMWRLVRKVENTCSLGLGLPVNTSQGPPTPGQHQAERSGNYPKSPRRTQAAVSGSIHVARHLRHLPEHL